VRLLDIPKMNNKDLGKKNIEKCSTETVSMPFNVLISAKARFSVSFYPFPIQLTMQGLSLLRAGR
jgi:hypothetical protein